MNSFLPIGKISAATALAAAMLLGREAFAADIEPKPGPESTVPQPNGSIFLGPRLNAEVLKPTTECAYVSGARIAYAASNLTEFKDQAGWITEMLRLNLLASNFGHEVEKGIGAVIQVRTVVPSQAIDGLSVMRLSFELARDEPPIAGSTNIPVTRDAYTFGFPAFIEHGNFWSGQGQIDNVALSEETGRIRVHVDGVINLSPRNHMGQAFSKRLSVDCLAQSIRQADYVPQVSIKAWDDFTSTGKRD